MTIAVDVARPQHAAPVRHHPSCWGLNRDTAAAQTAQRVHQTSGRGERHHSDRSPNIRDRGQDSPPDGLAPQPGASTSVPDSVSPSHGRHPSRAQRDTLDEGPARRDPMRAHHPATTPGPCVVTCPPLVVQQPRRTTSGTHTGERHNSPGPRWRSFLRGPAVPQRRDSTDPYQPVLRALTTPGATASLIGPATLGMPAGRLRGGGQQCGCQGCSARIAHENGDHQCLTRETWLDTQELSVNGSLTRHAPSHLHKPPHTDPTPPVTAPSPVGRNRTAVAW